MRRAARLELQHHPLALDARYAMNVLARNQQQVILKPTGIAIPPQHTDKCRRRRPKARPPDVNPILEMRLIPANGLHLQPEKAMRHNVPREHLDSLQVRKGPKQVERLGLRKPPDDLDLAKKTLTPAIHAGSRCDLTPFNLGQPQPEPLSQSLALDEERRPPRLSTEVHLECRGQVLAPIHNVVHGQLTKFRFGDDENHRSELLPFGQHSNEERLTVAKAARSDGDVDLTRGGELCPPFDLDGEVAAVREAVHDPIDPQVSHRQKHVQAAQRLTDQLRPHLELGHLPRGQGPAVVPPRVPLQPAAILSGQTRLNNHDCRAIRSLRRFLPPDQEVQEVRMKDKTPVVKQLYRLSVEPRVVERLATLANRTGEPRSRLATRLFTEAVLSVKPSAARTAKKSRD